jgi:methylglyoxal synthase
VKRIALVAHDQKKPVLLEWVRRNLDALRPHRFWATGTTGGVIGAAFPELDITRLLSGPLGGDAQIGAMIAEGRLDLLVFFIDPLAAQPHDVDVKALTRLAIVYDLAMACGPATADLVTASPLFAPVGPGTN